MSVSRTVAKDGFTWVLFCRSAARFAFLRRARDFMGFDEIPWDRKTGYLICVAWDIWWDRMGFDEIRWDQSPEAV